MYGASCLKPTENRTFACSDFRKPVMHQVCDLFCSTDEKPPRLLPSGDWMKHFPEVLKTGPKTGDLPQLTQYFVISTYLFIM
jgi:hypothetical protein